MDREQPPQEKPEPQRGRARRVYQRIRRPDRNHMDALKLRVPYWFVAAWLLAFASFQIWMNPFGFSDLVQRYSQDISDLLITGPYFYGTEGRDAVSVAIIDEDTLHTLQAPWPWKYGDHARALGALLAYHPKAVVVDFLFVDSRADDTLPELVDMIGRYKKEGVPLYFEGGINLPFGENPLRPELAATGVPILDPAIPINSGVARQYNATGRCFNIRPGADGNCPSLALHVFRDVYPQYPLTPLNDKMELVWGTKTAPENSWITRTDENGRRVSCFSQIGFFERIYLAFFDPKSVKNICPYTAEFPVVSLMMGADDRDVEKMAADRVVFYGGDLQGAQDKVYTPVNDLLPGVFVHAMAMDNLITYRGNPEQDAVSIGGVVQDGNLVQIIAVIPVILILSWLHMLGVRGKRRRAKAPEHDLSATLQYFFEKVVEKVWHYLAFALALGMGFVLTKSAGLSVANWVEVVFVSAELAALLLVDAPDAFWGYLHHIAGGNPELQGVS